ncbi:MAG: hypothetical protein U0V72_11060 [Cytophagales bacterium]
MYFSAEEVIELDKIQNKNISQVIAHYWVNITDENNPIKVLDTLEINFNDGEKLGLTGRTDECIKLCKTDIDKDREEIINQFHGKIVIQTADLTQTDDWKNAQNLAYISLRKDSNGQYLNDALLLCFESKELVIFYDGDSLAIEEVFEEIDEDSLTEDLD